MQTIHDRGYKKLFSNKVIFRQLIETFVHEDWVKDLDFEDCETLKKSFISRHYKETESDVIYKLRLGEKEVYFFILIEFQSRVERFMALRILNYVTNFYMDYVESNTNVKFLPSVFPILLYNGDNRWSAPTNLSDLIEYGDLLGRFSLSFEYFKIAENEFRKEDLLKICNIVSTLFLAESYYDIDLLKAEFLKLFQKDGDRQAVSLLLNWFKQLSEHQRIDASDYQELEHVYKDAEEVRSMLITALEKERKELYQRGLIDGVEEGILKGIREGREEGIEQGIEQGKLEDAKIMFAKGMSLSLVSEITGLAEEKLLKLQPDLED